MVCDRSTPVYRSTITQIIDYTMVGGTQMQQFSYDALNRLTSACTLSGGGCSTGSSNGQYSETYSYDTLGNLTDKAGVLMSYESDKPHAVTNLNGETTPRYSYDANGNMVSRNDGTRTWSLAWTPENMLQTATAGSDTITLTYDADGTMVGRTENGQTTNYLGKLIQHTTSNGTFTKQYMFNGQLIALREGLPAGSPVSFMTANQLGSTTTTLWADGTVRADQRYTPWGEERWTSNATPTQYQYTSQRNDSTLGLYDYNARYYDPSLGRFISADTIIPDPGSLQAFNRYAYVFNRPLNYTDPSGYLPIDEIQDYFGYDENEALAAWGQELFDYLWDTDDLTWGDVFNYDGNNVMLVLFESGQDTDVYRGGFWGLDGDNRGEEVGEYLLRNSNDIDYNPSLSESWEEAGWANLPRQTRSDGRNNYDPSVYVDLGTLGTTGFTIGVAGVSLFLVSNPVGWVAWAGGATTIAGFGLTVEQMYSSGLTDNYPVLLVPNIMGNSPYLLRYDIFGGPSGVYE